MIKGVFHVCTSDPKFFNDTISENIKQLQEDGQEVEVQYQPLSPPHGQPILTALILGRTIEEGQTNG